MMPELTRGPAPWAEAYRSRCKGLFPAYVTPGLHLFEWTSHNVDFSYFGSAAHTVNHLVAGCSLLCSSVPYKFQCCFSSGQRLLIPNELVLFCLAVFYPWLILSSCKRNSQSHRGNILREYIAPGCSKQARLKFLNCTKLINYWPDITCPFKSGQHYK